jgi:hypothetical protein
MHPYMTTTGAPLLPVHPAVRHALRHLGHFATAQGHHVALVHPPFEAMRGTRQPFPFPLLTFGGAGAGPGNPLIQTTKASSQGVFRPERLIIVDSASASGVNMAVTAMFVGSESCLVNNNPLTTALFQPTGVELGLTFPTAGPGITISITLANQNSGLEEVHTVSVAMLGAYVQGGDPRLVG